MAEICFEEYLQAYYDCRKKKRSSDSAMKFELDYFANLYQLYIDVNERKYEIGKSNAFVIEYPKRREIFAGDFRDRIIHHLIINKLNPLFENNYFHNDVYSCRKGMGTLYGVHRVLDKIKKKSENYTKDLYIAKFDIYGFFMSIKKDILLDKVIDFIDKNYHNNDIDTVKYLTTKVILHCPEKNCIKKSPEYKWQNIEPQKTLFNLDGNTGLPIGNLTSQIFAIVYLTDFDWYMEKKFPDCYGRYVDDFYVMDNDKNKILSEINNIKEELKKVGLKLHSKKIFIQEYRKGFPFIGYYIKPSYLLPGRRLIYNSKQAIKIKCNGNNIEKIINKVNSYLGFLRQTKSYKLRWRLLTQETKFNGKYVYATGCATKIVKRKNKKKKQK